MTRINSPTDRRLGFLNSAVMSGGIGSLICDFYLFDGPSGKTVMAMTVNPDVGLSAPDTLHPEGLYAFRFDLNGDAKEQVTFKFRFGEPRHGEGSEPTYIQPFTVRKATGNEAVRGDAGGVWLRVKPVRSRPIRVFVRMLGLLQSYLLQMPDSAHL